MAPMAAVGGLPARDQPRYFWLGQPTDGSGQLRRAAIGINRQLKRGKAFEPDKINGLLAVSLDANEQFCSDHRGCADGRRREVTGKDAQGQEFPALERH